MEIKNKLQIFILTLFWLLFPVNAFAHVGWSIDGIILIFSPFIFFVSSILKAIYLKSITSLKEGKPIAKTLFVVSIIEIFLLILSCMFTSILVWITDNDFLEQIIFYFALLVCFFVYFFPNLSILKDKEQQFIGDLRPPIKILHAFILAFIPISLMLLLVIRDNITS